MPNGIFPIYTRSHRQKSNSFRSDRQNSCGTESLYYRCFRPTGYVRWRNSGCGRKANLRT
jgi:hypothetical protein